MSTNKINLHKMMCLDVYLMSLPPQTTIHTKDLPKPASQRLSLISLDILTMSLLQSKESASKKIEWLILLKYAQQFSWKLDIRKLLACPYTAIVLTDINQEIKWVNKGFSQMSGYSRKYALGKKPSFLQGEKTCVETRKRIKDKLKSQIAFTEEIVNYRKNGEVYFCQVSITPLLNKEGEITHFIALENELPF